MKTVGLPSEFSDLSDLTNDWALDGMAALNKARLQHSMKEIDFFYQRMLERMDAIMAYLQNLPTNITLSPTDRNLYNLACAYMEVAPAVELFRDPDVPDGFPAERFMILK
mgnify:CR=1 FL=1|tara:strand:- start:1343 stop:1672 length:330 start_codon:yes stop_codon:yes gene_type:complete